MAMERENRAPRGSSRKRRKVCTVLRGQGASTLITRTLPSCAASSAERSKILPRRTTGTCAMHQRQLTDGHQAGPSDRPAALRHRIRQREQKIKQVHPMGVPVFCGKVVDKWVWAV